MEVVKEFVSVFVEQLLLIVLPVLATAFAGWILSVIKAKLAAVKIRLSDQALYMLDAAVRSAVKAAEQAKLGGLIEDKKEYAIDAASEWLKSFGYNIDLGIISAAIEAAVWNEFNEENPLKNVSSPEG
jgi:hypothetical protein